MHIHMAMVTEVAMFVVCKFILVLIYKIEGWRDKPIALRSNFV